MVGDVPAGEVLLFLSNLAMVMTVPLLWSARYLPEVAGFGDRLVSAVGVCVDRFADPRVGWGHRY